MRILATTFFLLFLFDCFGQSQSGRPMVSVDTVADLVARKPVPNERVMLSGLRSAGDFGDQRIIRHDPSSVAATNLGCVYATATTGRYIAEDCDGGEIDVRKFGIRAGSTNYAAANQAAWAELANYVTEDGRNLHKAIKFPTGEFYFEGPLNMYSANYTAGAD